MSKKIVLPKYIIDKTVNGWGLWDTTNHCFHRDLFYTERQLADKECDRLNKI